MMTVLGPLEAKDGNRAVFWLLPGGIEPFLGQVGEIGSEPAMAIPGPEAAP